VGDALGYAVDGKSWEEIQQSYGDGGLLGYDLQNYDWAEVTSYTQLAVFGACGLLAAMTREGEAQYPKYLAAALREWAWCQKNRAAPDRGLCWVAHIPALRRRVCMDTRMVESLNRRVLGTAGKPINAFTTPGALTGAVAVGLFFSPGRMDPSRIGTLGAQAVVMSHGDPETFLTGALIAYVIAGILQEPGTVLAEQFRQAAQAIRGQFGERFSQETAALEQQVKKAIDMVRHPELQPQQVMELLRCDTAAECMAGAMYACLIHPGNFNEAVTVAVNHSGRSCATGALAGAIMGAKLGEEDLEEFYLGSLECTEALRCLADDLAQDRQRSQIFDDTWDQKYIQGQPVLE
jgi:ADP-ribosylglycohydrolase